MAEIDPIIRDALKRSSQMQGNISKTVQRQQNPEKKRENVQRKNKNPEVACAGLSERENDCKKEKVKVKQDNTFDLLLKNKDQSLIFMLVILLMSEDSDPSLLLALIYLLI